MSDNNQPIYILPEGSKRDQGKSAQRLNIMAAKIVAETIRTTLGPMGMDKMLVDTLGDVIVTNDGVTILKEMQIEHPAAKMVVEIAKTQEDEVGDGTTTAVVLAGEFLKNAEKLLDDGIHPTVITKGFRIAADESQRILKAYAKDIKLSDEDLILSIANTAMTGKGAEFDREHLSKIILEAVKFVVNVDGTKVDLNRDSIKIEKRLGDGVEDTELVRGIILDKEIVHSGMPKKVKDAKILLLDIPLEIKETEIDAKIQITDPSQLQSFLDNEEKMLKSIVTKIANSGANVVFCQKGIDDYVQHLLAKNNIIAARRVKRSDIEKLALSTGAQVSSSLDELGKLGIAEVVEEVRVADDDMIYVRECKNPKVVTILVRGGTEHVVDEIKRVIEDAIGDISAALKVGKVIPGAAASEMELIKALEKFAQTLPGREQLAVKAFAKSLEIIPKTLAENAGLDPIDVLTELKSAHDKGEIHAGINVFTGKVMDAWKEDVIEPLKIKTQAIKSASAVAMMILRIDDVIASGEAPQSSKDQPED
ncbi:TCP-1/cpn60 chaperonin family protein [Candidatus Woesearchaeota archaeon]|nr:TCP-1/cpn60 chaperonin family protein [Candidatus Woesearchaeota archaeon]